LRKKTAIIGAGVAAGAILAGSMAFAAFSQTSSASVTGSAADMQPLVVGTDAGAPRIEYAGGETQLWPNVGDAHLAKVKIKVHNLNEVAVNVSTADITGSAVFDFGPDQAACGKFLKLTNPLALGSTPVSVPAKQDATLTVTGLYLDEKAPNACQKKPFHTSWTIVGNAQ
jgi:hypothetical protein